MEFTSKKSARFCIQRGYVAASNCNQLSNLSCGFLPLSKHQLIRLVTPNALRTLMQTCGHLVLGLADNIMDVVVHLSACHTHTLPSSIPFTNRCWCRPMTASSCIACALSYQMQIIYHSHPMALWYKDHNCSEQGRPAAVLTRRLLQQDGNIKRQMYARAQGQLYTIHSQGIVSNGPIHQLTRQLDTPPLRGKLLLLLATSKPCQKGQPGAQVVSPASTGKTKHPTLPTPSLAQGLQGPLWAESSPKGPAQPR